MGFFVVFLLFFLLWKSVNGALVKTDTSNNNTANGWVFFKPDDVDFHVATSKSTGNKLKFHEYGNLKNLGVVPEDTTIFFIHGLLSGQSLIDQFQEAYSYGLDAKLQSGGGPLNFVGVDWSAGSSTIEYFYVVDVIVPIVVEALKMFLSGECNDNKYLNMDRIHIVGHSLGAQIAGLIGKEIKKMGMTLSHITALDPAGIYYHDMPCASKLCSTDADYLEVIHTSIVLGEYSPYGVYDYYINGGKRQPHCWMINPICSHSYSHEWYRETLGSDNRVFFGWFCEDITQMEEEKICTGFENPRNYTFDDSTTSKSIPLIVYTPTNKKTSGYSNNTSISSNAENHNENKTIVFLGIEAYYPDTLRKLLSNDDQFQIHVHEGGRISISHDNDTNWMPFIRYKMPPSFTLVEIEKFLNSKKAPFSYSLVFDIINAYQPLFWDILNFLASNVLSNPNNDLNLVVMGVPLDNTPLEAHIRDIKDKFDDELIQSYPTLRYNMKGLHAITRSGYLSSQSSLVAELNSIQRITGST